jgi:DNA ligase-4
MAATSSNPQPPKKTPCIGDKKVVKVASLIKSGNTNVIKPSWILDAVQQAELDGSARERLLVPFEPNHMFHMTPEAREAIAENVDMYGDSYARDVSVQELRKVLDDMIPVKNSTFSPADFLCELEEHGKGLGEMRGSLLRGCVAYFAGGAKSLEKRIANVRFLFAAGAVVDELNDEVTHVVVGDESRDVVRSLRKQISARNKVPRVVGLAWLQDSWKEGTRLDEERFAIVA